MQNLQTNHQSGGLVEKAYHEIRERILYGDLCVGSPLSRRKLASQCGMSPVPIMQALQRLETEGLVESRPRVGTRVRVPTREDVCGLYVIREALETQAGRLFCENATSEQRRELMTLAGHLDQLHDQLCQTADHPEEIMFASHRLHLRFHFRIAECAGCPALAEAVRLNQTLVFKWLYDFKLRRPTKELRELLPPKWHSILIEALSGPDLQRADQTMRDHVRHGRDTVLACLETTFSNSALHAFKLHRLDNGSSRLTEEPAGFDNDR